MAKVEKIRVNGRIRAKELLLIAEDGEQLGVVDLDSALDRAQQSGLDLVEVAPKADPPVCRIMDYGKLKYDTKKKQHEGKKKQHVIKIKEVRFRPQISDHDFETKVRHARKFISDGNKVKVTIMFRGREMSRQDLGENVVSRVIETLADCAEVEKRGALEGRRFSVMLTPK
ncbi:MAG: translation initiation factor IF-3 [Candidatus Marinimicrobia bacterium]|nr:translation initiation factor IF-3 [Candidatus Neomarinimicrobiota bacterium]MDP6966546.1 translation initiation factor IF-3 [Candidatus Neomarinimicrobiota bacterium]